LVIRQAVHLGYFLFDLDSIQEHRAGVLSFCGSVIVVFLIITWASILTLGSALIMHPYLESSVRSEDKSSTRTNFWTMGIVPRAKKHAYGRIPFEDFCVAYDPKSQHATNLTAGYERSGARVAADRLMKAGVRLAAALEKNSTRLPPPFGPIRP
jgi:hypothetical protein